MKLVWLGKNGRTIGELVEAVGYDGVDVPGALGRAAVVGMVGRVMRLFHWHCWTYNHQELELAMERICSCGQTERRTPRGLISLIDARRREFLKACKSARCGIIGREAGKES